MKRSKITLLCLGLAFATAACESEMDSMNEEMSPISQSANAVSAPSKYKLQLPVDMPPLSENLRNAVISEAVTPSECAPTEFVTVQNQYIIPLLSDPVALANVNLYWDMNFIYSYYLESGPQYFGAKGGYTQLMVKRQREMEKFWNMPGQIQVNGQHNATLNDREALADIFESFGVGVTNRDDAYAIADELLALNELSPILPESPLFSIDGFASSNNLIVIGDGLVQMVSEAGIEQDIVWTGILAHEWAHQIQFDNYADWYPEGAADNAPEATRYTEMEADFMAAYYMTHKRGATYNWKRVEQFFDLFFQIGDCSFTSSGHHGTPLQRLAAARLGYETANEAQKQGHILSPQELHEIFVASVNNLL